MNPTETNAPPSPLVELKIRAELTPEKVATMIADMRKSVNDAFTMGYFERMEHNRQTRYCWWPGQTLDGRKWQEERDKVADLNPAQRVVFPWNGSSDVRLRLVDRVIRERVATMKLALARRQERIGPRELSPDIDPQQQAALWGQVNDYYEDQTKLKFRTAIAQAADIALEFGCGLVATGWRAEEQVVDKSITADQLLQVVAAAVQRVAADQAASQWSETSGRDASEFPGLTPQQKAAVLQTAQQRLQEMLGDESHRKALVAALMAFDETMPRSEATRVANELGDVAPGDSVAYYGTEPFNESPEFRALIPFVDVFFPATTVRIQQAPWVAIVEWVSEAELRARIDSEGYDEKWVEAVLEKPGYTFDFANIAGMSKFAWVLSQGTVCRGVKPPTDQEGASKLFQIIHTHYRPAAIGNVRAMYHTVVHGLVTDRYGLHECCEYTHGKFPLDEILSDIEAPFLLAAEGAGERSVTHQNEVKTQRDMRSDAASVTIKPPIKMPWTDGKKVVNGIRPGGVIPMRSGQGEGDIAPLNLGIDTRGSLEVETTTKDDFDEMWGRGVKMDPVVKQTIQQTMLTDFLMQVEPVKVMAFQLIQQYAPDDLKIGFARGLPVSLAVTSKEIQGMISLEMDFDYSDLDADKVEKRLNAIGKLLSIDNSGQLQRTPLLKALVAYLLPSHFKLLVSDPNKQAADEVADEQDQVAKILNGTQFNEAASYVVGTDHALRLDTMQKIFGAQTDAKGNVVQMIPNGAGGQQSRAQSIYGTDADVQARINNRFKFHARQIVQQQVNPEVGRQQVENVAPQAG